MSVQYQSAPEYDGPSARPIAGTAMAAPIRPPIPSVTPVRNWPLDTAARALAGSAYAPAAPAAASCPVWPPEGSATSLTSSEGVATGILRPRSDRCQRGNRPHKVPADF